MAIINGVGQSFATIDKQDGLNKYMCVHMKIVDSVFNRWPNWPKDKNYYYIDCTAGSGVNQDVDEDGSPVVFINRINKTNMMYKAYFIDEVEGNISSLRQRIQNSNCEFMCGNHNEVVPQLLRNFTGQEYGLFYMDMNGIPNFELLSIVSEKMSKMDILVRCPSGAIKRDRCRNGSLRESLIESVKKIHKEKLILREPLISDRWQWTFLFLTNYTKMSDWKNARFYWSNSHEGQEILSRLNYSKNEIDELNELKEKPNTEAKKRNSGKCEICNINFATEIHHRKGTYNLFDPENRIHICHECHCKLEGKNE